MKIIYENCRVKNCMKDHRSYRRNFCRLSFRNYKSCVYNCDDLLLYNRSNNVALRFGDHKAKEILGVVLTGFKLCATTSNNTQQHATWCANGRNM